MLDRTYAAAVQQSPIFTGTPSFSALINGTVMATTGPAQPVQPLAGAPVLFVLVDNGNYRGMVQSATDAQGIFTFDLGSVLDDYGITDQQGLSVYVRIGNNTTHDAVTMVLTGSQLGLPLQMAPITLTTR